MSFDAIHFTVTTAVILAGFYMIFRVQCVYRYRRRIIDEDFDAILDAIQSGESEEIVRLNRRQWVRSQALDFDRMVAKFWVWPLSRFEPKEFQACSTPTMSAASARQTK